MYEKKAKIIYDAEKAISEKNEIDSSVRERNKQARKYNIILHISVITASALIWATVSIISAMFIRKCLYGTAITALSVIASVNWVLLIAFVAYCIILFNEKPILKPHECYSLQVEYYLQTTGAGKTVIEFRLESFDDGYGIKVVLEDKEHRISEYVFSSSNFLMRKYRTGISGMIVDLEKAIVYEPYTDEIFTGI